MNIKHTLLVLFFITGALSSAANEAGKKTEKAPASEAVKEMSPYKGTEVKQFAKEPLIKAPSAIDVDSQGRVWVAEIVNYRSQNGKRPEGDRIVILEDTNGDGAADKNTIFYQDPDFISPHGICVIGPGKAVISLPNQVILLEDTDGDLKADKKKIIFKDMGKAQHDHAVHAFVQGADGRLYFNCGNAFNKVVDADGKIVVDKAGYEVTTGYQSPYWQGMVFRCDEDGSNFETLAWNFRNPWDLTVDSFGNVMQSDNDDDGN